MHKTNRFFVGLARPAIHFLLTMTTAIAAWFCLVSAQPAARAAGPDRREPWTAGHVTGTPEAPPPFELQRVFPKAEFKQPTELVFSPDGKRLFVTEQAGQIFSFPTDNSAAPELAGDLRKIITDWKDVPGATGFESIYGIAFHPRFLENHYVYICYTLAFRTRTERPIGTRVARFTLTGEPPRIDPASQKIIIEWQQGGHNAGCLKFGHDGMLYFSAGDQADPNPPDVYNTGQDISDLRASIMRIDVDHADGDKPYAIPTDNPFVKTPGARGEVWAYGLRNPWRFSFDRATGNTWVGDVGWELFEMVHCVKAGGNYGWSIMEGPNVVHADGKRGPTPITPPLLALSHAEAASITGGYVYRGKKNPSLVGNYIFGDWETRQLWAAKLIGNDKLERHRTIAVTDQRIVSFAEDAEGELYVLDYERGNVFAIVPNEAAGQPSKFPRTLKETGIFADVKSQIPATGVLPFSVNVSQWVDGATAERFIAIPGDGKVQWKTDDVYSRPQRTFPKDATLVRTLSLEMTVGDAASRRRLETQLMHFDSKQWHAYSYRWRDDQSDADLVETNGVDVPLTITDASIVGGKRRQVWHYASRAQCMTCHNSWAAYTLGFTEEQLDCPQTYEGSGTDNQLHALRQIGLLPQNIRPQPTRENPNPPKWPQYTLVNPYDTSASLEDRARSYLHVNCSQCHRMGGGGAALIDVRKEMTMKDTHAIDTPAMLGAFGIDDARVIHGGDPSRSVMLYRMSKTGSGRMPRIGSDLVDDRAVALLSAWIAQLPATDTADAKAKAEQDAAMKSIKAGGADQAAATDKLLATSSGGLALFCALGHGEIAEPARQQLIAKGMASPLPGVHDLFDRFSANTSQSTKLGLSFDRAKLLAMPGNAQRGQAVFQTAGQCATCHVAAGIKVREFGPDLSHIAAKYNREQLLENIVEPSKTIAEGFATYSVLKADGDVVTGFLVSQTAEEVVIKDANLQLVHIPAAQAKRVKPQSISAMPEGVFGNLEPQQAADLLEFLLTQK